MNYSFDHIITTEQLTRFSLNFDGCYAIEDYSKHTLCIQSRGTKKWWNSIILNFCHHDTINKVTGQR
jgi:hypothetical protein